MKKYFRPILIILVGLSITTVGFQMSRAQTISTNTHDTRARNATIGAGFGTGCGLVTAILIGGVGVATGGTAYAVGLPIMALLGAGGGALAGAATGSVTIVERSEAEYSPSEWGTCMTIGFLITIFGMYQFGSRRRQTAMIIE